MGAAGAKAFPTPLATSPPIAVLCLPCRRRAVQETKLGQRFVVDATLFCDMRLAGQTDELEHTVNYAAVHGDIREVVEGRPVKILEHLAARVAAAVLRRHPRVQAVRLHLRKPHVAIPGTLAAVGVEIFRTRDEELPA